MVALARLYLDLDRPCLPYVGAVVANGAVRRELADARNIEDGHAGPVVAIPVGCTNCVLTINVGLVVGEEHVLVAGE